MTETMSNAEQVASMTESVKLEPCPFCGEQPKSYWQGDSSEVGDDGYWAIECCDVHVHRDDEAEAIAAWNTRHQPQREAEISLGKAIAFEEAARLIERRNPNEGGRLDAAAIRALKATPAPAVSTDEIVAAWADVLAERKRQIEAEGWTPEHDDEHADTQLAGAAACYALASVAHWAAGPAIQQFWPWDDAWWKPGDQRRNLIKAAALILAEIERIDRAILSRLRGEGE